MKARDIHVRVDPELWANVKSAVRQGKLSGSLGQIVEKGLRKELADSEAATDSRSHS
jgi:hypothetical protein